MKSKPTLVVTPTYNERQNVALFIAAVLKAAPVDILIVDDSSPDGTGKIVSQLAKENRRVFLLTRTKKEGLGAAYISGFKWALEKQYDYIVSMDADLSHRPDDLPKLLNASDQLDVVIGSRYVPGGKIEGWDLKRHLNSRLSNIATRLLLGLQPKDVTSGFKRYSRRFLVSLSFNNFLSSGYAFQVEMINRAVSSGYKVGEVAILFVDRTAGESKIGGELARSVRIIWQLFLQRKGTRQLIKFLIVGGLNTLLDWAMFFLLRAPLSPFGQVGKQIAKAGSSIIAGTSGYVFNRHWTFRSHDKRVARQAGRFVLVAVIGFLLNNLIFYVVTSQAGFNMSDVMGLVVATGLVTFWNFTASKYWTFSS